MTEVLPVGDSGVLVELHDNAAAQLLARRVQAQLAEHLMEVVPGDRTVLLVWKRSPGDAAAVRAFAARSAGAGADCADHAQAGTATAAEAGIGGPPPEPVTVPVSYDGDDLHAVARTLGMTAEQVVELHCATSYTVAFIGFMPGFPYLIGGDPRLALPRLRTPRTMVPAGTVAVAAGYCGIYPRAAPGGWNLLGRTRLELFDPAREPPALLGPGTPVRFVAL